jgi:hypothetical protein
MSLFAKNEKQTALTTPVTTWVAANTTTVVAVPTHAAANNNLRVFEAEYAMITIIATGEAAASGAVTAKFLVRGHGEQEFSTGTDSDLDTAVTLSGTNTVRGTKKVDVRAISDIKLYSVTNADAAKKATVNVEVTYKH